MIVTCNNDQPGVIGQVGTILGRHGVNIATFALGRDGDRAVGVVIVDEPEDAARAGSGRRRVASGEVPSAKRESSASDCPTHARHLQAPSAPML